MTLTEAKELYQEEVAEDFARAELAQASAEYQTAMAHEAEQFEAQAAAAETGKKKKVRAVFPTAEGKSPNGFSRRMVTGQIDQVMVDYKEQNGEWPTAAQVAVLTGIDEKRVNAHIKWWQAPKKSGKDPLYL